MIIGHSQIIQFLERAILNNRVAHAYLFTGPEHVGKMAVALYFASKLFGISEEKLVSHPDLVIVPKNSSDSDIIGIDEVRHLRSRLSLSSFLNSWKIAIIEDASRLTAQAANALLKILEEPKSRVCFILLSPHTDLLPETMVSRCQVLQFKPVSPATIVQALRQLGADHDLAHELAQFSFCLPGRAVEFWQSREAYVKFKKSLADLASIAVAPLGARLEFASKVAKAEATENCLDQLIFLLQNGLSIHYNKDNRLIAPKTALAPANTALMLGKILRYKSWLKFNVSKQLILENILLNL